jgi:DNA transformation protein
MRVSDGFLALLKDLLSDLGTVTARRMFSGAGIYIDGVIFALVIDDVLYLKTDDNSRAAFEAEGLEPFSFVKQGKRISTSYWRAPELLLDDRTEMQQWAARALLAARRSTPRSAGKRKGKAS